jgi:hypothetical protein
MAHSSWSPPAGLLAAEHFCNLHRPEIPNLDADVELARQRLQAPVFRQVRKG